MDTTNHIPDSEAFAQTVTAWQDGALAEIGDIGPEVSRLLEDIRRAVQRGPEAARPAALQLITLLSPRTPAEPVVARGGLASWQKRKIERHLKLNSGEPLRREELAKMLGLSVCHFSRAFKQTFGESPHAYLIRQRLKVGQQLMMSTNDPLSQIALACGFSDQSHFSRMFRRVVGESPKAWLRRNLSEMQAATREQGVGNKVPGPSRGHRLPHAEISPLLQS